MHNGHELICNCLMCLVGIKVVTNAGGINVASCAEAVEKVAKDNGVDLTIATVTGDDLMTNVRNTHV